MIETEHTVLIDAAIDRVWDYVQDIRRWADLMPGMRECTVIDANDSRWVLKVGLGGLVRTIQMRVHVDQWDGPERVIFSYKLEGDAPAEGGGSYLASRRGADQTEVRLGLRVVGIGPMAGLWEAMSRPLLPQLAKSFSGQLKIEIERAAGAAPSPVALPSGAGGRLAAIGRWLRGLWRSMPGMGRDRGISEPRQ